MDIKIIDKTDIPVNRNSPGRGQWIAMIDKLGTERAIRLKFDNQDEARYRRGIILNTIRLGKRTYRIRTRLSTGKDGTATLYIWKEVK